MRALRYALYLLLALIGLWGGLGFWHWYAESRAPQAPRSHDEAAREVPEESARALPRRREAVFRMQEQELAQAPERTRIDPRWVEKNRAGIEKLKARELEAAVKLFEECVAGVPEETVFRANAAEACARLGNQQWEQGSKEKREAGLAHMRRALELAPSREDIAQRIEQMQRLLASEDGHWTESLDHYELSFDGNRSDLLWDSLTLPPLLESIYGEYGEHFDCWPVERGREKIRIVLYTREEFHAATGIGHWAGGVFDGAVRVPVTDLKKDKREIERVLRHEIAHAFVHYAGGRSVPGWLNEGLAQWLESSDFVTRAQRVAAARKQFGDGPKIALSELGGSLADLKEEPRIQRAYQQSLLLVDRIEKEYGERLLFQMVQACAQGKRPEATFRDAIQLELQVILDEL
jgi:tetratricopeptide (TPR) repeat protein